MEINLTTSYVGILSLIDYSEARDWYIKGDKDEEGIKYPSLPDIAREFEYSLSTLRKKAARIRDEITEIEASVL